MLKKLLTILSVAFLLAGCDNGSNSDHEIKVGAIAGPESHLLEVAKVKAKDCYGLTIDIVTFTDYNTPNSALHDGSIDANIFQHKPFLNTVNQTWSYDLIPVGKTFVYPMGIYSKSISKLSELSDGDPVAIPNDPSNEARALLLLQDAKLIHLKENATVLATPVDIVDNPKHLKFIALDAAQLPRSLNDVAIAVINTNFAIPAGLNPSKALFAEDETSLYDNVIVVRAGDRDSKTTQELIASFQSPEVLAAAERIFGGAAVAAWDTHAEPLPCINQQNEKP